MEIETNCNKCVPSNILEKQDNFPPDKNDLLFQQIRDLKVDGMSVKLICYVKTIIAFLMDFTTSYVGGIL